jgi:hopene-associated glycosyltransferase HpnB
MILVASLSLAIWVYLLLGHGKFWQAGPILEAALPSDHPPVVIIVPARDELPTIGRCLRSLLAQTYAGPTRVILVDDGSTDGTGDVARALLDPRLTVLPGALRPDGWSGKLWALAQGVAEARGVAEAGGFAEADGTLLLFSDADIIHQPEHLATLVAKREQDQLHLVSEMVALKCESVAERALVPAFVFFFQLLYPFALVNDPGSNVAAAAGGTVLIRAETLAAVGGLEAMRDALIDDVTLARRVKRSGRIWLGHSALASSIRPYPGVADVWRMVTRTAYVQLGFSPSILAATVAAMVLVWMVPPYAALFGHGPARVAGLLAWASLAGSYVPTLRRFGCHLAWAPFLPLVALFYTAATVGSAADHILGRGVRWKQRTYRV